jgi:hypothetical protein
LAAGWLCANAGTAIAADKATSAQIILRMASASTLCFTFSPSHSSVTLTSIYAKQGLVNPAAPFDDAVAPRPFLPC